MNVLHEKSLILRVGVLSEFGDVFPDKQPEQLLVRSVERLLHDQQNFDEGVEGLGHQNYVVLLS